MNISNPWVHQSKLICVAREIDQHSTQRLNVLKAEQYLASFHDFDCQLTSLSESTKEEVIAHLRELLQTAFTCCSRPKFTVKQIADFPGDLYTANLLPNQEFRIQQDSEFVKSLGLDVENRQLIALKSNGNQSKRLDTLMTILLAARNSQLEQHEHKIDTYMILNSKSLIELDTNMRQRLISSVKQLKSPQLYQVQQANHQRFGAKFQLQFKEQFAALPVLFNTPENKETIITMVFGKYFAHELRSIGSAGYLEYLLALVQTNFEQIKNIIINVVKQCCEAEQRMTSDFPNQIQSIQMTGSDLHAHASVHILTTNTQEKWVYKPRNIQVDMLVCGKENSIFARLNSLGVNMHIKLPTMDFKNIEGKYGYAQYIENSADIILMDEQEANEYYRCLGQLVVACKVFGIADIHQDNIMVGRDAYGKRPFIIDAEVAFLPHKIQLNPFSSDKPLQQLEFAETRRFNGTLANNAIISGEDLTDIEQCVKTQKTLVDAIQPGQIRSQAYRHSFNQGMQEMQNLLGTEGMDTQISQFLNQQTTSLQQIRLVPLATAKFEEAITTCNNATHIYATKINEGKSDDIPEINEMLMQVYKEEPVSPVSAQQFTRGVWSQLCDDLSQKIKEKLNYYGIELVPLIETFIATKLAEDLSSGNIPLMHYDVTQNAIKYHETKIGTYSQMSDITQLIENERQKICEMPPSQLYWDFQ